MWQFTFGEKYSARENYRQPTRIEMQNLLPLYFEEHCTECSIPDCYTTCSLYSKREDGGCKRFENGIQKLPNHFTSSQSVSIEFKKWGKLETRLTDRFINRRQYNFLQSLDLILGNLAIFLSRFFHNVRFLNALSWRRHRLINNISNGQVLTNLPTLVIQLEVREENRSICVEIQNGTEILMRLSVPLKIGKNIIRKKLPVSVISKKNSFLRIYPSDSEALQIIFHQLEVGFEKTKNRTSHIPAKYVKCVVWDLDNTIWTGILSEDGIDGITLKDEVVEVIKAIDNRGILNSISSKNNFDEAWIALEKFNLNKYFIAPKINNLPKSINLLEIAEKMDIGIDSFMFVDDSLFEIGEVQNAIPNLRSGFALDMQDINSLEHFNPPASISGEERRKQYQDIQIWEDTFASSKVEYVDFLKSTNLQVTFSRISSSKQKERAFELIARSNQLNLSGRKYSREEFTNSIDNLDFLWLIARVKDKFADYGDVMVARIELEGERITVGDLVISCRVADRHLEAALLDTLRIYGTAHFGLIALNYIDTSKNIRLRDALELYAFNFYDLAGSALPSILSSQAVLNSDIFEVELDNLIQEELRRFFSSKIKF
jgi:FkbH-like protein